MKSFKLLKENFLLSLILLLSGILNFANLNIEGYGNQYYAAGVKSMTMSLKNFFFVSFDPSSFVSIDKPPLGFWLQAISAKIFGFSGLSILLPEALAGVISVLIIYILVKRSFGKVAGLLSALFLAVTPVFVAVSRNNTCDNLLVLTLLLACWAISIGAEKGKLKYLILGLAIVGIGFNIKMLQAYMVLPAIYLTYLLSSKLSIKKRVGHLILGTLVLLVISFSWAIVVDLTPASSRPYVGSSTNNSELELIIGHNGLERLGIGNSSTGRNGKQEGPTAGMPGGGTNVGMPGGAPPTGNNGSVPSPTGNGNIGNQGPLGPPPTGSGQGAPGPMGTLKANGGKNNPKGGNGSMGGNAPSSIARLFSNNSLSDQIIWLFPLAIFGFVAAALKEKCKPPFDNKRNLALILWIMWLIPDFIYFSFTKGLFHPYYLTMLAPPIAALAGIGIVSMWELYKEGSLKSFILPIALILSGLTQLLVLSYFYNTSGVTKLLMLALAILCIVPSIIIIALRLIKNANIKLKRTLLTISLVGLLIAPTVWSLATIFYPVSGTFPSAGLELISNSPKANANLNIVNNNSDNSKLITFLLSHKTTEKYILVTSSTNGYASDIIIKTGQAVMTWGFFGTDKEITLDKFKELVIKGEVRYVMVGGQGGGSNNDIMNWVKNNGKVVAESEWKTPTGAQNNITSNTGAKTNIDAKTSATKNQQLDGGNSEQLYDLKGYANTGAKK